MTVTEKKRCIKLLNGLLKRVRGFPLQKVTLKTSLYWENNWHSECREPLKKLLRKAHSGVEGFPKALHMLFYSQQDALVLKLLPVKQLQLIFNSSTKKNRMCKRTFVCSLAKGKQSCAEGKVLLSACTTKASGYTPPLVG